MIRWWPPLPSLGGSTSTVRWLPSIWGGARGEGRGPVAGWRRAGCSAARRNARAAAAEHRSGVASMRPDEKRDRCTRPRLRRLDGRLQRPGRRTGLGAPATKKRSDTGPPQPDSASQQLTECSSTCPELLNTTSLMLGDARGREQRQRLSGVRGAGLAGWESV